MKNITYKIIIKGELTDLNTFIEAERRNRYLGAKLKKENTEYVMWQTKGLEPIRHYPLHIHMTWFTKNEAKDPDNVAFAKKYILDGLVKSGILTDDGRKQIKGFSDDFEVDKNPRIEVVLTKRG